MVAQGQPQGAGLQETPYGMVNPQAAQNRAQTQAGANFQNYWFGRGPIGAGMGGQAWTPEAQFLMSQNLANFLNPGGGRIGNENFGYGIPGQYGWAGFTRGTNPDPRQNPFVGDVSWLRGNNPTGPFDYWTPGFDQSLPSAMGNPDAPSNQLPYGYSANNPGGNATLVTNPAGALWGEARGAQYHGFGEDMQSFLQHGWNPFGGGGEYEKDVIPYV
jgi:hypothetical protein